jgi:DNA-binding transcriptional LysR family regulator
LPIDITSLRYAVLAADANSFARAASTVRIKQATLSRRISALEMRIGITLFERSTRGAVPTEAGQSFIELARSIIADLDGLIADSHAISSGRVGTLSLGFSTSLASGHMRALIVDFLEDHPEVRIVGVEGNRRRLSRALHTRAIDLAVIGGEIPISGLLRRPLWSERVMIVLPAGHALADKDRIYWTDLRRERFILARQDPGLDLADLLIARLGEPGLRPDVVIHDVTRDNVINMVSLGRFLSFTTEATIGRTLPGVILREIHDISGQARIDYAGYWRADNSNPAMAQMLELIGQRHPG